MGFQSQIKLPAEPGNYTLLAWQRRSHSVATVSFKLPRLHEGISSLKLKNKRELTLNSGPKKQGNSLTRWRSMQTGACMHINWGIKAHKESNLSVVRQVSGVEGVLNSRHKLYLQQTKRIFDKQVAIFGQMTVLFNTD